jgi:phage tail sheath gpL-like
MTIPFATTPSNLRVPLFYAELDPSYANTAAPIQRTLLIGQMSSTGTFTPNVPARISSASLAVTGAGRGSILAQMAAYYEQADPQGDLHVLPLSDAAGTAATGQIAVTGPATASGAIALYVAGILVSVPVTTGDTATNIATNIAAAINASLGQTNSAMTPCGLPVTATCTTGTVTLTAVNKGLAGNDIDLRINYRGSSGGEVLPTGVGITITAMANGATNPTLTTALANLVDKSYDFIVLSLTDTTSLAAVQTFLSDSTGRWGPMQQIYGHAWIALRGSAGTVAAAAVARNDQHLTAITFNDGPNPTWAWAASFAGAAAASLRDDPALPLQFLTVPGLLAPPQAARYPLTVRNSTLLFSGCSTWNVDALGNVVMENIITTYTMNAQGAADNSYLEVETMYNLMYVIRFLKNRVQSKYARVKLAADGTRVKANSNVVTPSTIRAELIAAYGALEEDGFVQNSAAFAANVVVEKNATNPNRVDILWPGTLINQLRVFATLIQFRLN